MKRVEAIILTEEELKAFGIVQKILDDLDFGSWTTDAQFVQLVATGKKDIDISDNDNYCTRSFKIECQ